VLIGGEVKVEHKMDWGTIQHELPEQINCTEMIAALDELVWQLDERYVKRHELPICFGEPEPQTEISDTADATSHGPCQPAMEPILITRNMVGTCSPLEDDEIQVEDEVERIPLKAKVKGFMSHGGLILEGDPDCYWRPEKDFRKVQPKAKCDYRCHGKIEYAEFWNFCPKCGLPLAGKE
jgi:hypothetical protein